MTIINDIIKILIRNHRKPSYLTVGLSFDLHQVLKDVRFSTIVFLTNSRKLVAHNPNMQSVPDKPWCLEVLFRSREDL